MTCAFIAISNPIELEEDLLFSILFQDLAYTIKEKKTITHEEILNQSISSQHSIDVLLLKKKAIVFVDIFTSKWILDKLSTLESKESKIMKCVIDEFSMTYYFKFFSHGTVQREFVSMDGEFHDLVDNNFEYEDMLDCKQVDFLPFYKN